MSIDIAYNKTRTDFFYIYMRVRACVPVCVCVCSKVHIYECISIWFILKLDVHNTIQEVSKYKPYTFQFFFFEKLLYTCTKVLSGQYKIQRVNKISFWHDNSISSMGPFIMDTTLSVTVFVEYLNSRITPAVEICDEYHIGCMQVFFIWNYFFYDGRQKSAVLSGITLAVVLKKATSW